MKRGRWILLTLVVVLAFPVSLHAKDPNPAAAAKPKFDEFTGTETMEELVYFGDITATPGGAFKGRNRERIMYHDTTDPRVRGTAFVVLNANGNPANEMGPAWGTMRVVPDGEFDGAWEATWHAPPGRPEIKAVGYGTGVFEGLKAWWTFDYSEGAPAPISGRILDPHGE